MDHGASNDGSLELCKFKTAYDGTSPLSVLLSSILLLLPLVLLLLLLLLRRGFLFLLLCAELKISVTGSTYGIRDEIPHDQNTGDMADTMSDFSFWSFIVTTGNLRH